MQLRCAFRGIHLHMQTRHHAQMSNKTLHLQFVKFALETKVKSGTKHHRGYGDYWWARVTVHRSDANRWHCFAVQQLHFVRASANAVQLALWTENHDSQPYSRVFLGTPLPFCAWPIRTTNTKTTIWAKATTHFRLPSVASHSLNGVILKWFCANKWTGLPFHTYCNIYKIVPQHS